MPNICFNEATRREIDRLNTQIDFFPEDVKYALNLYISDSNIFNDVLRLNDKSEIKLIQMLKNISKAFELIEPTKEEMIVYRGMLNKDPFNPNLKILTSTSYDINSAGNFIGDKCCIYTIIIPKNSKVLCLDTISLGEKEILLPPGGIFETNYHLCIYKQNKVLDFNKIFMHLRKIQTNEIMSFTNQLLFLLKKCGDNISCITLEQKITDDIIQDDFIKDILVELYIKKTILYIKPKTVKDIKYLLSLDLFKVMASIDKGNYIFWEHNLKNFKDLIHKRYKSLYKYYDTETLQKKSNKRFLSLPNIYELKNMVLNINRIPKIESLEHLSKDEIQNNTPVHYYQYYYIIQYMMLYGNDSQIKKAEKLYYDGNHNINIDELKEIFTLKRIADYTSNNLTKKHKTS